MGVHDHSAPQTPDLVEQQKQQVFTLKSAIAKLREESVPKGSRLQAFLIRECRRVVDGISKSSSADGSGSGRKLIGSGHRDPSPDAPQGANQFAYSKETLERRRKDSMPTSGFLKSGVKERYCDICEDRPGWEGLTRKNWFACGFCLAYNEKGVRPCYGQGTGKGRGRGHHRS